jgi:hypothetical protein
MNIKKATYAEPPTMTSELIGNACDDCVQAIEYGESITMASILNKATLPAPSNPAPKFERGFGDGDGYVCDGDTISVDVDGFTVTAEIVRDDSSDAPDERQDGFWPSDDPKADGFIGDGYKLTEDELSESFEFVNHGVEHSQSFQGCGVSGTDFEEVSTGIGSSYREALDDAFEQACSSQGFHVSQSEAIEAAILAESEDVTVSDENEDQTSEVWHHASIRYNLVSPILKAKTEAQRIMDAWKADEWWYVGVRLSVKRGDVTLCGHAASVWGIECNYPRSDDKLDNSYLTDTANELLDEALDTVCRK